MAEEFTYKLEAELNPTTAKVGTTVTLTARITGVVGGEINSVQASIPEYGWWGTLRNVGENTWRASESVPYGAPFGKVNLRVYAVSKDSKRGPQTMVPITLS
ncbi:MAG: protein BatD [Firmicutes bacterium]|nr:protein BatD [Bacillota bacterium]